MQSSFFDAHRALFETASTQESAAFCLARNLTPHDPNAPQMRWPQLVDWARNVLCAFATIAPQDNTQLFDEAHALPLIAAARVLDGATQFAPDLSLDERRVLGLMAACAFGMNGNFPSATTVVRRAFPRLRARSLAQAAILACCAPTLLPKLSAQLQAHRPADHKAARFVDGLDALLRRQQSEAERDDLRAAFDACFDDALPAEAALMLPVRVCLEHQLTLSVARVQREQFPDGYLSRLVASGVPVLLPPQWKALNQGVHSSGQNAVVSLPPSTGKTLLGEMCLLSALQNRPGLVVFLAPYVALGRQTAASLEGHVPSSVRVHRLLGGYKGEAKLDPSRHMELVVATPERLDALLRMHPELLSHLCCVVCDEAHNIQDGTRGVKLEGLLTRLRLLQSDYNLRLVLLSAVLGRAEALIAWMNAPSENIVADKWKPTARRLAFWRPDGSLTYHAADAASQTASGEGGVFEAVGSGKFAWPARLRPTEAWTATRKSEPLAWHNVAHLAHHLWEAHGGAILCVCATKQGARKMAESLGQIWTPHREAQGVRAKLIALLDARYGYLRPLRDLLVKGLAWHNATLPHDVRAGIEECVRAGELDAVASTTTLAEGVDLPLRWTILSDWLHWGDGGQAPMSPLLFRNVAGRCGRAGIFTEGDTIVFDNPLGPLSFTGDEARIGLQEQLYLSAQDVEPESAWPDATAANEAALASQLLAAGRENPSLPDFATRFLAASYAHQQYAHHAHQQNAALHARLETMLQTMRDELLIESVGASCKLTPLGEAVNLSGFSPSSCARIIETMREICAPQSLFDAERDETETLSERAVRLCASLLQGRLPEDPGAHRSKRSRLPARPDDYAALLTARLQGRATEELFATLPQVQKARGQNAQSVEDWLSGERDSNAESGPDWNAELDRFGDWSRVTLETWLPWLLRACDKLAPFAGELAHSHPWKMWAEWFEAGVDSAWALHALKLNAPGGRRALAVVGGLWPQEWTGDFDLLGASQIRDDVQRARAEQLMRVALKEVGGRYNPDGRGLLELREWLWQRIPFSSSAEVSETFLAA